MKLKHYFKHRHYSQVLVSLCLLFGASAAHAVPTFNVIDLGTLGGSWSRGFGINDHGQVTGVAETAGGYGHAFLYDSTSGTMTDLGTLGGGWSAGRDINDHGQVTGVAEIVNGTSRAFLYDSTSGTMTDLGIGGSTSYGQGINNNGQVTGLSRTPSGYVHAFLYDSGTMTGLGTLGGHDSMGIGINDHGQVTGGAHTASGDWHAFLYDSGTLWDLNDLIATASGWVLEVAYDINNHGQIAGYGTFNGAKRAFLLDPVPSSVPEPASLALVSLGLARLGLSRGRQKNR